MAILCLARSLLYREIESQEQVRRGIELTMQRSSPGAILSVGSKLSLRRFSALEKDTLDEYSQNML